MIHLIQISDEYVAVSDDKFQDLKDAGYFTVHENNCLQRTVPPAQLLAAIDTQGDETGSRVSRRDRPAGAPCCSRSSTITTPPLSHGATLLNDGWQPDGHGVTCGGDTGGDSQAGGSFSIRFQHPDHPNSMITVTFYPVVYDKNPDEYVVQRQVEWLVCTDPADPGGTEVWSDISYDDPFAEFFDTPSAAETDAKEAAEEALGQPWIHDWDGQPDWSTTR